MSMEGFEEQNTNEANEEEASSSTTGKTRSSVWLYFERVPIGPDGVKRASCTSCGTTYLMSGTSNMKRHIRKCFEVSDASGPPQKRARLDQKLFKEKMAISIIKHNYSFSYVEHDATRELHIEKVGSIESGLRNLYTGYKVRADAMHDLNLATSQNVAGEGEDIRHKDKEIEKQLVEDIEKLI
ncbi:zinc finger, BED-type [Artemisia annua]|uniref:Zinc finger, BED-type n=1 Tax=Artemisia annua TaxID=35608 RepID=A0A2U1MPZ5_ARTAN|nr:zinc finger, BED-type [Artemisia annua]